MKFRIIAEVTISISTDVEAETAKKAIEIAKARPLIGLCHQCSAGEPSEEWVTSGELDGEPVSIKADKA